MDTDTYNYINIDTYTDIHLILVAGRVLTLSHLAKDCFEDGRWFVFIIVSLCVIIRAITGTFTSVDDINTTKSGCKPLRGFDTAGSVCTICHHQPHLPLQRHLHD